MFLAGRKHSMYVTEILKRQGKAGEIIQWNGQKLKVNIRTRKLHSGS